MPLRIIKDDILDIKCDAMVNPTDFYLSGSVGLDKRIHTICGPLLKERLYSVGSLDDTNVLVTDSCGLCNCKHLIHVTFPKYYDGKHNEFKLLRKSYKNILKCVLEKGFNSVAIPLISLNSDNNVKKEAFNIALEEINEFLYSNDIQIYLVVNNDSLSIDKTLSKRVNTYINENLEKLQIFVSKKEKLLSASIAEDECSKEEISIITKIKKDTNLSVKDTSKRYSPSKPKKESKEFEQCCLNSTIYDKKFELDESFSEAILRIIDEKGLKDPDVYKKAGIDRKLFSSLRSKKNYIPSKKTAISLCIALELDIDTTNDLLKKAGLALSHSKLFDVIIEYFIKKKHYDLYDINVVLLDNDQETIGC